MCLTDYGIPFDPPRTGFRADNSSGQRVQAAGRTQGSAARHANATRIAVFMVKALHKYLDRLGQREACPTPHLVEAEHVEQPTTIVT